MLWNVRYNSAWNGLNDQIKTMPEKCLLNMCLQPSRII